MEIYLVISMLHRKITELVKLEYNFTPLSTTSNSPIIDFQKRD